jgi:hypothetical protein
VSNGHGFEFTPLGIRPIGAGAVDVGDSVENMAPAAVHRGLTAHTEPAVSAWSPPASNKSEPAPSTGTPLKPKALVQMARARIKELRAILPPLTKELAELERLVNASRPRRKANAKLTQ